MIPEVVAKLNRKESTLWPDWKIPNDAMGDFRVLRFASTEMSVVRKTAPSSDWHAGDIETAIQLYIHPDLSYVPRVYKAIMIHYTEDGQHRSP